MHYSAKVRGTPGLNYSVIILNILTYVLDIEAKNTYITYPK